VTTTPEEGRVLGCLVEKQLTTPQQYPLTANALSLACNQTTNREPVVAMDEDVVLTALAGLKEQRLVRFVLPSHGRSVTRYRHVVDEVYAVDTSALALLAVLLLRGPQTPGELRSRAERMAAFAGVDIVQAELERLAVHPEGLVRLLPRRPGQKEDRWQQLLARSWPEGAEPDTGGADPSVASSDPVAAADRRPSGWTSPAGSGGGEESDQGISALRREVEQLRAEMSALRVELAGLDASLDALRKSLGG